MKATIYYAPPCREERKILPLEILKEEGFDVTEKIIPVSEMIQKSKAKVAYSWCVEIEGFDGVACSWKEVYELLEKYVTMSY